LFGTDSPWSDAAKDISVIESLPLTVQEKQEIYSGNAKKVLNYV